MRPSGKKKALVTGATGFIGSHLTRYLHLAGWDVAIVVRKNGDGTILEALSDVADIYQHDGTTSCMSAIMKTVRPDVVYHLASLFLSDHKPDDVEPLIRSNILLGAQLLEAMAGEGVRLLVNAGTAWQHYRNREYDPVNLYAATKQAFEDILRYYVESGFVRVITLKIFDTYGPGDRRRKLFTLLREASLRNEPLAMSPGKQKIDLVYIDDVLSAFEKAANRLLEGKVRKQVTYAVSSGAPIVLRKLVSAYLHLTGRDLTVQWGGRPYRRREVMSPGGTWKTVPGWRPMIGLKEGIHRMEQFNNRNS